MVVRFMFLLMHCAVGTFSYAADTFETRANVIADVFYKQYQDKLHEEATQLQPRIGGIKVVLMQVPEQQFQQESARASIVFSQEEIDQLSALGTAFTFASIYKNDGVFFCNAVIKERVRSSAPTFIMAKQPGEAVVLGLQKQKQRDILQIVRTICLNLGAHYVHDPIEGKPRIVSEDEQWDRLRDYYSNFNQKPSRLVHDKYGKIELEGVTKKILLPDGE